MDDGASHGAGSTEPGFVLLPDNPPPDGAEAVWYEGRRGRRLRLLVAPPRVGVAARGTALVCPGRTEFIEKYFEVGRDLQAKGFAVVIFDWPGQGLSARMRKNRLAGHVRTYGTYIDALVRGVVALGDRAPRPYVMVAHSMGGTIALEALRRRRIDVAGAAFSAPMWGLDAPFYVRWFARAVRLFGGGGISARREGPPETFAGNLLTHDEPRWRIYRRLIEAEPRLAVGQPTIGWVVASFNVMRAFFWTGAVDHLRNLPMMVAIAGEEGIVKASESRRLAKRFREARVVTVKGARHEILMETDERRAVFWTAFDEMCKRAKV